MVPVIEQVTVYVEAVVPPIIGGSKIQIFPVLVIVAPEPETDQLYVGGGDDGTLNACRIILSRELGKYPIGGNFAHTELLEASKSIVGDPAPT